MPEGPSIVILKEELQRFKGKKVLAVSGNSKAEIGRMMNRNVSDFKSWGKHFLICFPDFFIRIHMLMWGTYRIDERKDALARLTLTFRNGEVNFYSCSLKLVEGNVNEHYNWASDVMADEWDPAAAEKKMKLLDEAFVCDALLNQDIFSGVGNIIKNEVLFRIKVHPESLVHKLSPKKRKELVKEARNYSFDFYCWKKEYALKKNWLIYKKKECPRCKLPTVRTHSGKGERLTFYCANCQKIYR